MQFTVVDAGVAVITLLSAMLAYSRGFTRELFAIGGWVIAAVVAFFVAPAIDPLIREIPVIGPKLAESCLLSMFTAFAIVVAIALMILSVFTPLIAGLVLDSALGPLDRMLGFLFGLLRGVLLIAIAFLVYQNFSGAGSWPELDNAASRSLFEEAAAMIEQYLPDSIPDWFGAQVDSLMVNCESAGATPAATDLPAPTTGTGTGTGTAPATTSSGN